MLSVLSVIAIFIFKIWGKFYIIEINVMESALLSFAKINAGVKKLHTQIYTYVGPVAQSV